MQPIAVSAFKLDLQIVLLVKDTELRQEVEPIITYFIRSFVEILVIVTLSTGVYSQQFLL